MIKGPQQIHIVHLLVEVEVFEYAQILDHLLLLLFRPAYFSRRFGAKEAGHRIADCHRQQYGRRPAHAKPPTAQT